MGGDQSADCVGLSNPSKNPLHENVVRPPANASAFANATDLRPITVDASKLIGTFALITGRERRTRAEFAQTHPLPVRRAGTSPRSTTPPGLPSRPASTSSEPTTPTAPATSTRASPHADGALIDGERTLLSLFPNPDADPERPGRVTTSVPRTQLIASIKALGAEVIFRVGRSEGSNVDPPKDFARYAEVVKHVVPTTTRAGRTASATASNTGKSGTNPTSADSSGAAPPSNTSICTAASHAPSGRPIAARSSAGPRSRARTTPRAATRIRTWTISSKYVRANRLPLDFYSWHWYATDSNDPLDIRANQP